MYTFSHVPSAKINHRTTLDTVDHFIAHARAIVAEVKAQGHGAREVTKCEAFEARLSDIRDGQAEFSARANASRADAYVRVNASLALARTGKVVREFAEYLSGAMGEAGLARLMDLPRDERVAAVPADPVHTRLLAGLSTFEVDGGLPY
jgi:hypothetical protein